MERKRWGYGPGETPPPGLPEPEPPPEKETKARKSQPIPEPAVEPDPIPTVAIAAGQTVRIVNRHRFSMRYPQIPPEVVAETWKVFAIAGNVATIEREFYQRECPAHWLAVDGDYAPANQCTRFPASPGHGRQETTALAIAPTPSKPLSPGLVMEIAPQYREDFAKNFPARADWAGRCWVVTAVHETTVGIRSLGWQPGEPWVDVPAYFLQDVEALQESELEAIANAPDPIPPAPPPVMARAPYCPDWNVPDYYYPTDWETGQTAIVFSYRLASKIYPGIPPSGTWTIAGTRGDVVDISNGQQQYAVHRTWLAPDPNRPENAPRSPDTPAPRSLPTKPQNPAKLETLAA